MQLQPIIGTFIGILIANQTMPTYLTWSGILISTPCLILLKREHVNKLSEEEEQNE
jgi:hypothetical protein